MKPAFRLIVADLLALTFYSPLHVSGQIWTQTSAPSENWHSIASSADGSRLFVASLYGDIYTSTNAGQTWNPTGAPSTLWRAIACSADGTNLIAAAAPDYGPPTAVLTSHDLGVTWTNANLPDYFWTSVASSADGRTLAAASSGDPRFFTNVIYTSSDSGATWTLAVVPNEWWTCIAASSDGMRLAVTGPTGTWTSTNGGLNWGPTTTPFAGQSVAVSGDGSALAVLWAGSLGVSHDWGVTWLTNTIMPDGGGGGTPKLANSANGTYLAALGPGLAYDVDAFLSTDAGSSWSNSVVYAWGTTNNCAIASSADGGKLAVALAPSVFTYQTTPAPVLHLVNSADNIVLSWIIPSQNFVLQQSSDLITWSPVGVTPALNYTNLHYDVTVLRTGSQRFYRLASP